MSYELRPRKIELDQKLEKFKNPETIKSLQFTIAKFRFDDQWDIWDTEANELVIRGSFDTIERIYLQLYEGNT